MRDLRPIELDAVSGGDFDFDLNKKNPNKKPKQPQDDNSTLEEVVAYGRRFFGSWRVRLLGFVGAGGAAQVVVDKAIDNNGNPIEEVLVVAERIDPSDVPPAFNLFGPAERVALSDRIQDWSKALENMSPEELNLLAKAMDALKADSEITAALDAIVTQVQNDLKSAAKMPPDQRGMFAGSIATRPRPERDRRRRRQNPASRA